MNNSSNIFEKYPKLSTFFLSAVIFSITVLILAWILKIDILQDSEGSAKYSISDKIKYAIRCNNERHIKLRENSPNQNRYILPNTRYKTLEHKEYLLKTNNDGLIEPAFIHKNPDLQIFFIGGSTTECENVDAKFRFPHLVGRILEEKTGLKINSDNAARSGNNSLHSINIVVNKILPYKPDMIVMMHNVNDLSTLIYEGSYWNNNKSKSTLSCSHKNSKKFKEHDEWSKSVWQQKVLSSKEEQKKILEKYKKNLSLFVNISRSYNITPVLMTQPNRIEKTDDFMTGRGKEFDMVYKDLYIKFNQMIRDFGKNNNILVIDLANSVPGELEYIYDQIHMNQTGSIKAANKIAKDLVKYLEIK